MILKWSFFFGAAVMAAYMLISRGIPVLPVLVGCALAALITWRNVSRRAAQDR
jgi:hypothetical protein